MTYYYVAEFEKIYLLIIASPGHHMWRDIVSIRVIFLAPFLHLNHKDKHFFYRGIVSAWPGDDFHREIIFPNHRGKHLQAHVSNPKPPTSTYLGRCSGWKCRYLFDGWFFFLVSGNHRALALREGDEQNRGQRLTTWSWFWLWQIWEFCPSAGYMQHMATEFLFKEYFFFLSTSCNAGRSRTP